MKNLTTLATNISYYQWEYDYNSVIATILLDNSDNSLYIDLTSKKVKSGLGKGDCTSQLEYINLGKINTKIDTTLVQSILKKYNISQHKFSKHWEDEEGNLMLLSELLLIHQSKNIEVPKKIEKKELKHIKSIDSFDKNNKDIEIIKYSDKAYAIFGDGTRNIKDKLSSIGCRYNKFLTDPKTGKKRAGWICSISKIDLVKNIIKEEQ